MRIVRGAHVAGLLIGVFLLLSSKTTTLDEDHQAISAHPTLANVRASIQRHPLDYYSFAVAADLMDGNGDRKAIRVLNHAMLLHPTHPDLHRMAARMLYRDGYVDQSTIEYAAAIRSIAQPTKLVSEILTKFPPDKAAAALPVDFNAPELLVHIMSDQGRGDVATRWLERVLQQRPKDSRACEQLSVLAANGSAEAAVIAAHRCVELLPDYQTRFALAQQLFANKEFALVPVVLDDIESWQTRADDKINAWLLVCDAHTALAHVDDAKRCLRRLDASPDMRRERGEEIVKRLLELQKAPPAPPAPTAGSAATP
jgi:tetratricopeptide (TPR) repeat protein